MALKPERQRIKCLQSTTAYLYIPEHWGIVENEGIGENTKTCTVLKEAFYIITILPRIKVELHLALRKDSPVYARHSRQPV